MVPSTVVLPRRGSLSLASLGRTMNAWGASPPDFAGRSSFALKQDWESVAVISV